MRTDQATLEDAPREVVPARPRADRVYRGVALSAGFTTLVILLLIGLFLFIKAVPAFHVNGFGFFTTMGWCPDDCSTHKAGIGAVMIGTLIIALIALSVAVPVSIGAALFLSDYAPRRWRRPLTSLVDLLAAVPALIFGIWGLAFLQPRLMGVAKWLTDNLGFIPIFRTTSTNYASSQFITGVVVSLMLLPTATAIMREVFSQAPPGEKEAALALGSSRWRMVKTVVIPFGRGGIVGGSMLALGRALGEAISVASIINAIFRVNPFILQTGGNSVGALIANRFGDSSPAFGIPALMGAGLVLFVVTLVVNTIASLIVRRSRSGKGVEI